MWRKGSIQLQTFAGWPCWPSALRVPSVRSMMMVCSPAGNQALRSRATWQGHMAHQAHKQQGLLSLLVRNVTTMVFAERTCWTADGARQRAQGQKSSADPTRDIAGRLLQITDAKLQRRRKHSKGSVRQVPARSACQCLPVALLVPPVTSLGVCRR